MRTQSLAPNLPALVRHLIPGSAAHLLRPIAKLARERDDLGKHELGHTTRVGKRRVEHGNALPRRKIKIDLVRSDAEAADDEQVLGLAEDSFAELGLGPDSYDVHLSFGRVSLLSEHILWTRNDSISSSGDDPTTAR